MSANVTPEVTPTDPAGVVAPAKKSKVRRNLILAGSAAGLVGIGSTLAANINLNSGENVEFGQGVARTTACDEDGFTITPVTSYDNSLSIFRLDYVEVTGVNLTPEGTGYNSGGYNSQADAIAAHPGEYYDNGWKRTCDGVVLDFKAYTDDVAYWGATREGYSQATTNDISSPLAWAQFNGNTSQNYDAYSNFGIAVVFDTGDGYIANWAVGNEDNGDSGYTSRTTWLDVDISTAANSAFIFGSDGSQWRPNAASISKITVSSMKTFPSNYSVDDPEGPGTN
jgi:hypothetical protein